MINARGQQLDLDAPIVIFHYELFEWMTTSKIKTQSVAPFHLHNSKSHSIRSKFFSSLNDLDASAQEKLKLSLSGDAPTYLHFMCRHLLLMEVYHVVEKHRQYQKTLKKQKIRKVTGILKVCIQISFIRFK